MRGKLLIDTRLITKDKTEIAINHYKSGHDKVIIIAPGWCMTKDSDAFCQISQKFAQHYDVISFDFRGHGKSSGTYTVPFSVSYFFSLESFLNIP